MFAACVEYLIGEGLARLALDFRRAVDRTLEREQWGVTDKPSVVQDDLLSILHRARHEFEQQLRSTAPASDVLLDSGFQRYIFSSQGAWSVREEIDAITVGMVLRAAGCHRVARAFGWCGECGECGVVFEHRAWRKARAPSLFVCCSVDCF